MYNNTIFNRKMGSVPLVLLPGAACNELLWRGILPFIPSQMKPHIVDLLPYESKTDMLEAIYRLPYKKFALLGFSMGGYLAQEFYVTYPERVNQLIFICSSGKGYDETHKKRIQKLISKIEKNEVSIASREYISLFIDSERETEGSISILQNMLEAAGSVRICREMNATLERVNHYDALQKLSVPSLVVGALKDKLVSTLEVKELAQALSSPVHWLDCGHMAPLEAPCELGAILNQWFISQLTQQNTDASINFINMSKKSVRDIEPYQTAKSASDMIHDHGLTKPLILLANNENPFPPSIYVQRVMNKIFNEIRHYPDPSGLDLKVRLSEHLNTQKEKITLGNGSSELISLLIQAYAGDGDEVVISQYAYALYETCIKIFGAKTVIAPAKNWGHDPLALHAAITKKTKMVIIANPNNPTGTYITGDELEDFMRKIPPYIIVIVDEAYFEYIDEADYPNGILLQEKFRNLVVTRTFSKIYGLAGFRVGYAISDEEIAAILNRIRLSFNVNSYGLVAAAEALLDHEYVQNVSSFIKKERKIMVDRLEERGLHYLYPSANFISLEFKNNAKELFQKLVNSGLLVRQLNNYKMPDYLRITIGTECENMHLIDAIDHAMSF